jgi:hypothetical protein
LLYKQQEKRKVKIMEKVKGVKPSVNIKDQGTVKYSTPEKIANGGKPGRHGAGKSRGGGAALRGTKFYGVC